MNPINHNFQTIIIGAGGAGLMAALSCVQNGVSNVAVISKIFPTQSHTAAAKGGINAALGNVSKDNWRWHYFDTIKGADYLADYDAVELMCKKAPQAIIDLEKAGVVFSRNNQGKIDQRIYGGQKTEFGKGKLANRACFSKDRTGHTILNSLYQQCLKAGVKFFNEFFVSDLLIKNKKQAFGAVAIDLAAGKIHIFKAKITILATGGYGQIYQNSTAADICTGDGNALLLKENLQLQDMEFVQFHPTALYNSGLLISEAARGEGGYLINALGQKFMSNYAPEYGDLASRDVISRAIANEIRQGRGGGENKDQVYLVISHLGEKIIKERIPAVLEIASFFGRVNPLKEPIPIAPAAHYTMGGIPTDVNCQVLYNDCIIKGLMAIGEAACASVHGANRLGCNSLLDIIVFGNLSGQMAANLLKDNFLAIADDKIITDKLLQIERIFEQNGNQSAFVIKDQLKQITERFIGVFRNEELLNEGLSKLLLLKEKLKQVAIKNKNLLFNDELVEFLQTKNLLLQAIATCYSALKRTESRGAHFRQDFPNRDDKNWLKHSLVSFDEKNNHFDFKSSAVRVKEVDGLLVKPEKRDY